MTKISSYILNQLTFATLIFNFHIVHMELFMKYNNDPQSYKFF